MKSPLVPVFKAKSRSSATEPRPTVVRMADLKSWLQVTDCLSAWLWAMRLKTL